MVKKIVDKEDKIHLNYVYVYLFWIDRVACLIINMNMLKLQNTTHNIFWQGKQIAFQQIESLLKPFIWEVCS